MNTETKSGDCETCGAYSSERVDGMCAPCRKKYIAIADEKALRDGLITKSDYLKIWVDGVEVPQLETAQHALFEN
ncbi:MAG: hypothetical protein GY799_29565 [Desulfobulbaceae bacterium]|nr:hypothetical protein [Desulfobulbaceae bacterium]